MTTDYETLAVDLEELGRNCGLPDLTNAARKVRALGVAATGAGPFLAGALRVNHLGRTVTAPGTHGDVTGELAQVSHWDEHTSLVIVDRSGPLRVTLKPTDTVQVHE